MPTHAQVVGTGVAWRWRENQTRTLFLQLLLIFRSFYKHVTVALVYTNIYREYGLSSSPQYVGLLYCTAVLIDYTGTRMDYQVPVLYYKWTTILMLS